MYTRCIDSNLESGRYISRVGRASSFLSLYGTYGTVGTYGTAVYGTYGTLTHDIVLLLTNTTRNVHKASGTNPGRSWM